MVEYSQTGNKHGREAWSQKLQSVFPLFEMVRPKSEWASRDMVRQSAKKTIQHLNQDLDTLQGEDSFMFSGNGDERELTKKTVEILRRWHLAERAPSLTALIIFAIEHLKPEFSPDISKAVLAASVLGEVESNLPYHNNMHFRKVLLQIIRLIAMHNDIYADTPQEFDNRQVGLLLIAACIHDLGHDGKGNTIRGVFETGRLERQAYELAEPYLEKCGLNKEDLNILKVMLLCTDVAPLGDPTNPINQMKSAYRYHFLGQKKKTGPLNLDEDLMALEKNANLTMMAIILHEADIGTSAGLDYTVTSYETSLYKSEMGEEWAYPEDVVDFLNDICQRQMLSDAAQKLYAANMARIFALAEKEIADGNHAFPRAEHSDFIRLHPADRAESKGKTIN